LQAFLPRSKRDGLAKLLALSAILSIISSEVKAMTTSATTGQPVQVNSGSQVADLATMLQTLFGQSARTTQTGDTGALQALLAQLQGADYSAALQGIFQQAAGQIPGFQSAYGNAMGARSGGNTAMQAALNELLKQTTLAGAKQTADLQLQNQQIQANAAGNVAATNQTKTSQSPGVAKELAGVLALMQAGMKLTGSKDLSELGQKLGMGSAPSGTAQQTVAPAQPTGGMSQSAPQMSTTSAPATTIASLLAGVGAAPQAQATVAGQGNLFADLGLPADTYDFSGGISYAPGMEPTQIGQLIGNGGMSTSPLVQPPDIMNYFGTAAPDTGGLSFDANDWEQYL
jgi:hypothetical protein